MPVSEALEAVLAQARESLHARGDEGRTELVSIGEAKGRVLSQNFVAPWDVPRTPTSIKDGYAVNAAVVYGLQAEETLDVQKAVYAGSDHRGVTSGEKEAVYVTTGSAIPSGFDAVVEVEQTQIDTPTSRVAFSTRDVQTGQDIRAVGSDIAQGKVLVTKGSVIDAPSVGIFASFGQAQVQVFRRPRIGVMSTGDELLEPNAALGAEEVSPPEAMQAGTRIFDANRAMLITCSSDASNGGPVVVDLGILADRYATSPGSAEDEDKDKDKDKDQWMLEAIEKHDLDVLVTSGGVSVGQRDFVRPCLERNGTIHVERLLMKPGKPMVVATVAPKHRSAKVLVFGVPGNPVSSVVTFHLLVAPALRVLAGWHNPMTPNLPCILAEDITLDPIRPEYHRATLSRRAGRLYASSTGFQRSSALASMLGADVLLKLPSARELGTRKLPAGTQVSALVVRDIRQQSNLCSADDTQEVGALCAMRKPSFLATPKPPVVVRLSVPLPSDQAETFFSTSFQITSVEVVATDPYEAIMAACTAPPNAPTILVIESYSRGHGSNLEAYLQEKGCRRIPGLEEAIRSARTKLPLSDDIVAQGPAESRDLLIVCLADDNRKVLAGVWPLLTSAVGS